MNASWYYLSYFWSITSWAQLKLAQETSVFSWDLVLTQFMFIAALIWGFRGCWRFMTWVGIFILIWIWSLAFAKPMFKILDLYLDFKGAWTSMYDKSWFGALEDAGGSWLGFGILIFIWLWSIVFSNTPMFQVLALYLDLILEVPC